MAGQSLPSGPALSMVLDPAVVLCSKSGSKRIFDAAEVHPFHSRTLFNSGFCGLQVPVPIGAHDIYDEDDFYTFLTKLIVQNLGQLTFK